MMKYRPPDWKIPREVEDKSFEAGADAMSEGLIKEGWPEYYALTGKVMGYRVFIPEDKVYEEG